MARGVRGHGERRARPFLRPTRHPVCRIEQETAAAARHFSAFAHAAHLLCAEEDASSTEVSVSARKGHARQRPFSRKATVHGIARTRPAICWNRVWRGVSCWNRVWRGVSCRNRVWRGPVCWKCDWRGRFCRNLVSRGSSNGKPADWASPNGIPSIRPSPNEITAGASLAKRKTDRTSLAKRKSVRSLVAGS